MSCLKRWHILIKMGYRVGGGGCRLNIEQLICKSYTIENYRVLAEGEYVTALLWASTVLRLGFLAFTPINSPIFVRFIF